MGWRPFLQEGLVPITRSSTLIPKTITVQVNGVTGFLCIWLASHPRCSCEEKSMPFARSCWKSLFHWNSVHVRHECVFLLFSFSPNFIRPQVGFQMIVWEVFLPTFHFPARWNAKSGFVETFLRSASLRFISFWESNNLWCGGSGENMRRADGCV